MTLLEFLSSHIVQYNKFKIHQSDYEFEIIIHLNSTDVCENLQLSITKIKTFNNEIITLYLRDKNVFGSDSYVLNRFSTLESFENESILDNVDFEKFCKLIKQYVTFNS